MATLTMRKIRKDFGPVTVLQDIDLDVADGEFVVLVGPSGCGKSTLLRVIAGLEKKSGGELFLDEREVSGVPASERGLAMVFQSYALYPHMTVYQNMAFGLENSHLPRTEIDRRVDWAATMLRLGDFLARKPSQLSGGQRQRVAIGRAMVRNPLVFLFDEPLSNLDAELRVATRKELSALHAQISTTMIYVTHDQVEAMTLADKIVVMRDGIIEQVGTPLEVYNSPENAFVAGFIGSPKMNFLPGKIISADAEAVAVRLANGSEIHARPCDGAQADMDVQYGIRPEHIEIVDAAAAGGEDDFQCKVDLNEQLGGESYIYCDAESLPQLTIHHPGQNKLARGDVMRLRMPRELGHLFDSSGRVLPPIGSGA